MMAALAVASILAGQPVLAEEKPAPAIETSAKEAIIVDGETGAVLFERNADEPFPPASLAKLMTMEVVFDALKAGRLSLDQEFPISIHAWRTGGAPSGSSTMFAKVKSMVPLGALVRGTIVQSANDAAIAIAEGMAGSEEGFARLMNERAAALGLTNSHFVNPTGLPAEGEQVTARDMATLARHIEETYPELYKIYSEPSFEWNKIFQRNRNPLLSMDIGADGMETGYVEASGYSLVGVTKNGARETFLAMSGLPSAKERASEARKLLEWANTSFTRSPLFAAGDRVGSAEVYGGARSSVPLMTKDPIVVFVPKNAPDSVTAKIHYDGPVHAPVRAGDEVGRLEVSIGDQRSVTRTLYAAETVEKGSFPDRALDAAEELAFGWLKVL